MKLGVDAVNLSLGSPAGFTSRPDMLSTMTNLEKAGIVVAAAGNEYTAAYKNLWENDNCKALEQVYFLGNPPENVSTRMFVSKVADMTVYYDAALAAQWAPEGETTWCGYPLAATISTRWSTRISTTRPCWTSMWPTARAWALSAATPSAS